MTAFVDAMNFFLAGFILGLFGPALYKLILKIEFISTTSTSVSVNGQYYDLHFRKI